MSPSEYGDLVAFLGEKFERIDRRFEQIDRRFEQIDQRFEQIDRRFENMSEQVGALGVLVERNQAQIRLLAEGLEAQNAGLEALRAEMHEEFASVRAEMRAGFEAVHARVDRLEAA